MDYFYGKTRFEITLQNETQIKERLGVNTKIQDFFNATDSAVREQFERVFDVSKKDLDTSKCKGYDEWCMAYILEHFNGDLKQVEQSLRSSNTYNSRNGLAERMKKFKTVKQSINKKENGIIRQIRNML